MAEVNDGPVRRTPVLKYQPPTSNPPAWLGNAGGGKKPKNPWDKLNELGPTMGLGGGSAIVPNFTGLPPAPLANPQMQPGGYAYRPKPPGWLEQRLDRLNELGPTNGLGGGSAIVPNFTGLPPAPLANPQMQPGGYNHLDDALPSAGGSPTGREERERDPQVMPGGYAYTPPPENPTPTPGTVPLPPPQYPYMPDVSVDAGSGGGFGTNYGSWGRGGRRGYGGGYGGGYGSSPQWVNDMMNLYSWNFKG